MNIFYWWIPLGMVTAIYVEYYNFKIKPKLDKVIYKEDYEKAVSEGYRDGDFNENSLSMLWAFPFIVFFWPLFAIFTISFHIDRLNDYKKVLRTSQIKHWRPHPFSHPDLRDRLF